MRDADFRSGAIAGALIVDFLARILVSTLTVDTSRPVGALDFVFTFGLLTTSGKPFLSFAFLRATRVKISGALAALLVEGKAAALTVNIAVFFDGFAATTAIFIACADDFLTATTAGRTTALLTGLAAGALALPSDFADRAAFDLDDNCLRLNLTILRLRTAPSPNAPRCVITTLVATQAICVPYLGGSVVKSS